MAPLQWNLRYGCRAGRSSTGKESAEALHDASRTYLHITNNNTIIPTITNNLVLDLLPALHTLFDEDLRTRGERLTAKSLELLLVLRKTGAETTKSVSGPNDDRVANDVGSGDSLVLSRSGVGLSAAFADLFHSGREKLTVLRRDDGVDGGTEDLATE